MFWYGAKALTQGGVTALERLDFLEIFRMQLFHLKMNTIYLIYGKLMPSLTSVGDEGSLAEIKDILPKMERIGCKDKEISKHFELHDQLFATTFQAKAGDAWLHYLKAHPDVLDGIHDERSAAGVVITFLKFYNIELFFDPDRTEQKNNYDDLANYDREGIALWVLTILLDDGKQGC
jgi:hypothetical protein